VVRIAGVTLICHARKVNSGAATEAAKLKAISTQMLVISPQIKTLNCALSIPKRLEFQPLCGAVTQQDIPRQMVS
jgi:hypothetical protein